VVDVHLDPDLVKGRAGELFLLDAVAEAEHAVVRPHLALELVLPHRHLEGAQVRHQCVHQVALDARVIEARQVALSVHERLLRECGHGWHEVRGTVVVEQAAADDCGWRQEGRERGFEVGDDLLPRPAETRGNDRGFFAIVETCSNPFSSVLRCALVVGVVVVCRVLCACRHAYAGSGRSR